MAPYDGSVHPEAAENGEEEVETLPGTEPFSAAHALLWGLRKPRDEAQLTQVVAEVARKDAGFAGAFVKLLLDTAESQGHRTNVRRLRARSLPEALTCRADEPGRV